MYEISVLIIAVMDVELLAAFVYILHFKFYILYPISFTVTERGGTVTVTVTVIMTVTG